MNQSPPIKKYRNILIVCLIALLFFSPFWIANWIFYHSPHVFKHTTNHGILITPPVDVNYTRLKNLQGAPLDTNPFKGQWTLLAIAPEPRQDIIKKLYEIRQIRLMLGKHSHKVQRMLLFCRVKTPVILSSQLIAPYTGTVFTVMDEKKWVTLFKLTQLQQNPMLQNGFFIIDPSGRLIMRYQPDSNPRNIMQDLRRLIEAGNYV